MLGIIMPFSVLIASPPGNVHAEAFCEVAQSLHWGLTALGHEASLARLDASGAQLCAAMSPDAAANAAANAAAGPTAIVLGSNLLHPTSVLPPRTILYNLEQLTPGSPWVAAGLLTLLRRHPVWEYSQHNLAWLAQLGVEDVTHVPIGYAPCLTRIAVQAAQDIDVLFFGSINDRRRHILQGLARAGLSVHALFGVYGEQRDALIARAKVVLNVHFYDAKILEVVRISYLLANRACVVSETGADGDADHEYADGVVFAPYERLIPACVELVRCAEYRADVAARGFELMRARPVTQALAPALCALQQRRGAA